MTTNYDLILIAYGLAEVKQSHSFECTYNQRINLIKYSSRTDCALVTCIFIKIQGIKMNQNYDVESNRKRQQAGQQLTEFLNDRFSELKSQGIIEDFVGKTNFRHDGFSYDEQYKTNFIISTFDEKYIIVNTSTSFRSDRNKQDMYDFEGIMRHAPISESIIASVLLFPDEEFNGNSALRTYRNRVKNRIAYSAATHILSLSEFIEFLDNHKATVLQEQVECVEEGIITRDGSYYGKAGNAFEKEVVRLLNSHDELRAMQASRNNNILYSSIVERLCFENRISLNEVIRINATNTVKKLASGGNAKTDIILDIELPREIYRATISVKNTTQTRVSCHDYKADDFIRVLGLQNTKLARYFFYLQEGGSRKGFEELLPEGYSIDEFEYQLQPYRLKLTEWALKGLHDEQNILDESEQTSQYVLIKKNWDFRFENLDSYIKEIFTHSKLVYGTPFSWTRPSTPGRIQLKMPVLINC